MDSWVVGQVSFWLTVYEVNPTRIVDKVVSFWLDLVVPGRGAGETSWWMQGFRSMEQQSERVRREMDIRRDLRQWDSQHPEIHHELLVRYICGAVVSVVCNNIYHQMIYGWRTSGRQRR